MTEHDQRVCLRAEHERLSNAAEPAQEYARLEEVLTPKPIDHELEACLRADAAGDPQGATNVGVLLEEKGDLQGALAAYRRADRRGDVNGTFNLGCLLAEMGDQSGAQAALRSADERGDGAAASNLGVLLEGEGDLAGAFAAYHRGDERGDANAAYNLGLLLAARGDLAGARAAYRRAAERGDAEIRERAVQAEAEIPAAAQRPPRRWIVVLCLLALATIVVARRR